MIDAGFRAACPEADRGEQVGGGVVGGAVALDDGVEDEEVASGRSEVNGGGAVPVEGTLGGGEEPGVDVATEEDAFGDGVEAASECVGGGGESLEVPEFLNIEGIEPGFAVAESAILADEERLEGLHVVEDGGREAATDLVVDLVAESEVVVAPDAGDPGMAEDAAGFLETAVHAANVAEMEDLLYTESAKAVEGLLERFDGLMNVGKQP